VEEVNVDIVINASPDAVWTVVSDVDRLGEWVTIHRAVERRDDGPIVAGFTMAQRLELNANEFVVAWTASEVDGPKLLRWEGEGPVGSRAVTEYRLIAEAGGTRFRYRNGFDPPGGLLGGAVAGAILGEQPEDEACAWLTRLRELIESMPDGDAT
jgi:uncharacterized membrane protein